MVKPVGHLTTGVDNGQNLVSRRRRCWRDRGRGRSGILGRRLFDCQVGSGGYSNPGRLKFLKEYPPTQSSAPGLRGLMLCPGRLGTRPALPGGRPQTVARTLIIQLSHCPTTAGSSPKFAATPAIPPGCEGPRWTSLTTPPLTATATSINSATTTSPATPPPTTTPPATIWCWPGQLFDGGRQRGSTARHRARIPAGRYRFRYRCRYVGQPPGKSPPGPPAPGRTSRHI